MKKRPLFAIFMPFCNLVVKIMCYLCSILMMTRIEKKIALWVWIILLIVIPAVPHHHHGHRVCVVVERCVHDGAYNDEHTAHHEEREKGGKVICDRHLQMMVSRQTAIQQVSVPEGLQAFAIFWGEWSVRAVLCAIPFPLISGGEPCPVRPPSIHALRAPPVWVS